MSHVIKTTVGSRVVRNDRGTLFLPGEYGPLGGAWHGMTPEGDLANLSAHVVTEHADGTITVEPSILVTGGGRRWHGFLKAGVWEELSE